MKQLDDVAGERLPITRLHRLEVMNALELHVFQSRTIGQPSAIQSRLRKFGLIKDWM